MRFCRRCGHEQTGSGAFCASCGARSSDQLVTAQMPSGEPARHQPVGGETLRQILADGQALRPEQAFGVLDGVVATLAVLHAEGAVHGDVRPETIVLDSASGSSTLIGAGALEAGSPSYRAPEVLAGALPDQRSDLYGIGAVLVEALSGRPPAGDGGAGTPAHRRSHRRSKVAVPELTGAAPEVVDLCQRMLDPDPSGRPDTAGELREALEAVARTAFGPQWRTRASVTGLTTAIGDSRSPGQAAPASSVERAVPPAPMAVMAPVAGAAAAPAAPAGRSPKRRRLGALGAHEVAVVAASVAVVAAVAVAAGIGIAHVASTTAARSTAAPRGLRSSSRPAPRRTVTTVPVTTVPVTPTSPTSPTDPSTSPRSSAVAMPTALPVVECPRAGPGSPSGTPAPPSTASATVTPAQANQLELYSGSGGGLLVLAPRSWSCEAVYTADGRIEVTVVPPGTPSPNFKMIPPSAPSPDEAVNAYSEGGCLGCQYVTACPFVSFAGTQYVQYAPDYGCTTPPSAEAIDWIRGSSTSPTSTDVVGFEDPPGVAGDGSPSGGPYPANGVLIWLQGPQYGTLKETCTLPSSEHALCTAILNDFIGRYGNS